MKGELLIGIATLVALVALAAAIFLAFSPGELPHNVSHVSAFQT